MLTPEGSDAASPEPIAPFRVVSLLVDDGKEPPSDLSDQDALAAWSAATAPWHPALLALADDIPRLEDVAGPSEPRAGDVRLVASSQMNRLPPDYRQRCELAGVPIVEASVDRFATVQALMVQHSASATEMNLADPVAGDYLALGAAYWWLRDLTIAMSHSDTLSRATLGREALSGARSWRSGDPTAATNRLRASFELITEARERFYPMDGYILDLCLLDPATPSDALKEVFEHHTPVTLLASGRAIETFADREPERAIQLREAITEGWADVIGGAFDEVDEPFLPWTSLAWQFREGAAAYRRHLEDRNVETLARRRFALYPQLPQIARRFGLRFGIFVALDSGRFPIHPEAKRLWASPDGSTLESVTRPPIGADRPAEGSRLAWRIGKSMRDDVIATLALAHWPSPVAPWFVDFRRTAAYSPVLSRWVTVNDFFHRSDRPFEEITPALDDYAPAYLTQAVARRDPSPIARRAAQTRARARLDALISTHALACALAGFEAEALDSEVEREIETGSLHPALETVYRLLTEQSSFLASKILGDESSGRPGFLVINPLGVARRAAVRLPGASNDLRPEGPLRFTQKADDEVWGVVDLPPFGFGWVPRESPSGIPSSVPGSVSGQDRTLTSDSMTVTIDPATGGLRSIQSLIEETPRLGQQLSIVGLVGADGKPAASRMRSESFRLDHVGPALAQATSIGTIHHPSNDRMLARFEQRFRIWAGRPTLEIQVTISEVDPTWRDSLKESDPWTNYLAFRWAWPDAQSTLRRTALLAPFATESDRPETPDAIDITSRQRRTTLLFGGLAHHKRHTPRMLDTILLAGSEQARVFELGVALELEHPFLAALDLTAPAIVVPTESGPPRTGPAGWLLQVDHKSVAILRLCFEPRTADGQGWGLVADLIETGGKAARCRLRAFRDPVSARQVDGHGEHVVDLSVDRDAALIDLTPYEIARVELTLG